MELYRTAFSDYGSLLELKRYDKARQLLWDCKRVFEREMDLRMLGDVFSALADLEDKLGRMDQAIEFKHAALRYSYPRGNAEFISACHNNLGNHLLKIRSDNALAHHLAGGIICYLIRYGFLNSILRNLHLDCMKFEPKAIPATFDQLCQTVEEVEGVKFKDLFCRLTGSDADGDKVMQEILSMAQKIDMGTGRPDIS